MRKPKFSASVYLLIGTCSLMLYGTLYLAYAAGNNPHLIDGRNGGDCQSCHVSVPGWTAKQSLDSRDAVFVADRYKLDAVGMCTSCHPRDHLHADVGDKINFPVPADMPLGENKSHVCITCHFTHGRLDSEKPRANVDFLDRWFDSERMHKSYLLRRDNSEGGLCLTCHKQGINP